jgi:hypothetical protein
LINFKVQNFKTMSRAKIKEFLMIDDNVTDKLIEAIASRESYQETILVKKNGVVPETQPNPETKDVFVYNAIKKQITSMFRQGVVHKAERDASAVAHAEAASITL